MKKVVIIGAGPAGLTAAYWLLKNTDCIPVIYESSDTIGGISQTINHNENRIDIGGHRFFSKSDEVVSIWKEILRPQGAPAKDELILNKEASLAAGGANPETDDDVFLTRHRVSRIYFLRKFFDYPISLKLKTFYNMGLFRTIYAGFGYMWSAIFKRKENNLEDFMINRFGKPLYKMFFRDYTAKVWGRSPKDISADWGEQRIKGLSLRKAVGNAFGKIFKKKSKKAVETSLIESFMYPKYGPGQLYETMAKRIVEMGGEIHMNTQITNIEVIDGKVTKVLTDKRREITGYAYISTMPVKDLFEGFIGDKVDERIKNIAVNLPYRDFITVGLLVDKLKLKNKTKIKTVGNIVPDCWIYIQERNVKIGRLQVFNNWSPYMVKDFENKVWIGLEYFCNEGDEMWNLSDDDMIDFGIAELVKIGIIDAADVSDKMVKRIKKAYPAYFDTYKDFKLVKKYLTDIDGLYCAGRNGQHRYNNMDHSMLSGIECAKVISGLSDDKNAIFEVNADRDYQETK